MSKFKKDRNSGGRDLGKKSFGDRGFGGRDRGGDRERSQMHDAVCDECGRKCQVPFRPTGDKPVYCSDCFGERGGREDRGGRDDRKSFGGNRERSFGGNKERQMFGATCSSCGQRCEVPFRPTGEKPVYCDNCFGKNKSDGGVTPSNKGDNKGVGDLKEQLNSLHAKLDKLLKLFGEDVAPVQTNNKPKKQENNPPKADKEIKVEDVLDIKDIESMIKESKEVKPMGKKVVEKEAPAKKAKPAAKKVVAKKAPAKKKK